MSDKFAYTEQNRNFITLKLLQFLVTQLRNILEWNNLLNNYSFSNKIESYMKIYDILYMQLEYLRQLRI